MIYKDLGAAILVYDLTNKKSFEELQNYWIEKIKDNMNHDTILVIVANKSDLIGQEDVDEETARNYAQSLGAIFIRTTAKKEEPINNLFIQIAKKYTGSNYIKFIEEEDEVELEEEEEKHKTLKKDNDRYKRSHHSKCMII